MQYWGLSLNNKDKLIFADMQSELIFVGRFLCLSTNYWICYSGLEYENKRHLFLSIHGAGSNLFQAYVLSFSLFIATSSDIDSFLYYIYVA